MKLRRVRLTDDQKREVFSVLAELHDRCPSTKSFIATVQTFPGLQDYNLETWKDWNSRPDIQVFYIVSHLQRHWPKPETTAAKTDAIPQVSLGEFRHVPFRRRVSGEP